MQLCMIHVVGSPYHCFAMDPCPFPTGSQSKGCLVVLLRLRDGLIHTLRICSPPGTCSSACSPPGMFHVVGSPYYCFAVDPCPFPTGLQLQTYLVALLLLRGMPILTLRTCSPPGTHAAGTCKRKSAFPTFELCLSLALQCIVDARCDDALKLSFVLRQVVQRTLRPSRKYVAHRRGCRSEVGPTEHRQT